MKIKQFFANLGQKIKWFFTDGIKSFFVASETRPAGIVTLYKKPSTKSVLSSLICIVAGILVGFIILLLLALFSKDIKVGEAFRGLFILLGGPFASGNDVAFILGDMFFESAALIMTGLSVGIAFKTGLFNIGAPGQYLMGAMASLLVALSITPSTPAGAFFAWVLALLAGCLAGMIWGCIPGLFKAFFGVNEVIVCIMTNWTAANVVSWVFADSKFINVPETKTAFLFPTRHTGVMTPRWGLDKLFPGSNIDIGIFVAILIAILIWVILNKTTLGYELKACGLNKNSAKYAGMNEKRNIVLSMAIAGGLAGIGACLYYLNGNTEFQWNTYSALPDTGFNGIPASLLANNSPIGCIFTGIFLKYLGKGGFNLAGYTSFNEYVSSLVVALIIYFAGFSRFIKELLDGKKSKKKDKKPKAPKTAAKVSGKEEKV